MKRIILEIAFLLITPSLFGFCPILKKEVQHPNLLFVFPDQFRQQAMGFMKEDPVLTPNIDKLAIQGVVFVNAVSNRPLCTPYRGMLFTGKYCFSNHLQTNCNTSSRKYGNYLHEDENCFSDVLSKNGYFCGYIGKWHLDTPTYEEGPDVLDWQEAVWESYTPPGKKRHGFQFWHAYGCNNQHNNPYYWVNNALVTDTLFAKKWSSEHEADVAIQFIENNDNRQRSNDKPWALFISMNPPHGPYNQVPQKYKDLYVNASFDSLLNRPNVPKGVKGDVGRKNVRDYFACVSGVDEQLGRILDALEKSGQTKNTIVVFSSDHGEMMGSHGLLQKVVWYEESFKIPLIVRWPNNLTPGRNAVHFNVPDFMPTFLTLMGMKNQIPTAVEGEDLAKNILGKSSKGSEFSLYLNPDPENVIGGMRGLRNDKYTLVIERDGDGRVINYRLFDNISDPYQLQNISDANPSLVKKFERELFDKIKTINDPWAVCSPKY